MSRCTFRIFYSLHRNIDIHEVADENILCPCLQLDLASNSSIFSSFFVSIPFSSISYLYTFTSSFFLFFSCSWVLSSRRLIPFFLDSSQQPLKLNAEITLVEIYLMKIRGRNCWNVVIISTNMGTKMVSFYF